ncbi:MAG: hypothetical protein HY688_04935 [Chloroflexi bacterium]|nr:hypothetical protein [Chloroflexota bacterium]
MIGGTSRIENIDTQPEAARLAYWRDKVRLLAPAPDFALRDTEGHPYRLADYRAKATVVLEFGAIT